MTLIYILCASRGLCSTDLSFQVWHESRLVAVFGPVGKAMLGIEISSYSTPKDIFLTSEKAQKRFCLNNVSQMRGVMMVKLQLYEWYWGRPGC